MTSSTTSSADTSRSLSLSGRAKLEFVEDELTSEQLVYKTVPYVDREQPKEMQRYGRVYLPVHHITVSEEDRSVRYCMPLAWVPDIARDGDAALVQGFRLLEERLWEQVPSYQHDRGWRDKLRDHLVSVALKVGVDPELAVKLADRADGTGRAAIHGDASLANLVYLPDVGWRWIDPMNRDYVPCFREVDVGKMLVSAFGFERVLLGIDGNFSRNRRLVNELLTRSRTNLGIDVDDCWAWFRIHVLRVMPYLPTNAMRVLIKPLLTGNQ